MKKIRNLHFIFITVKKTALSWSSVSIISPGKVISKLQSVQVSHLLVWGTNVYGVITDTHPFGNTVLYRQTRNNNISVSAGGKNYNQHNYVVTLVHQTIMCHFIHCIEKGRTVILYIVQCKIYLPQLRIVHSRP